MFKNKGLRSISAFDVFIGVIMAVIVCVTLYPFYYIVIASFNDATDLIKGGVYLWPREFTLANYQGVFDDDALMKAFGVTVARTVIGTVTSVLFTAAFSYGISKTQLVGRKYIIAFMMFTMYFNGGLIPTYLLIKDLGLMGNFMVYIIPMLFSAYNAIIMMSFFRTISPAMEESAKIDGANDMIIFIRLILPVSMPVLATIALYNGVAQWNSWFDAMLYGGKDLQTVQQILIRLLNSVSEISAAAAAQGMRKTSSQTIRLATMVVTTVPIVCVYPFLQKYFVKGVMIGSVKE